MINSARSHVFQTHFLALLLAILLWPSDSASADERVLVVRDGAAQRQYSVQELTDAIGITELTVSKDPHFGADRTFAGFALKPLLEHVGLGDVAELMLVCADGYRIPFDASILAQQQPSGLLAIRDTALPAASGSNWEPYKHGAETVSFDPFYLTWAGSYDRHDRKTESLPWPYQLTEIQRFDRDAYFMAAEPPAGAGNDIQKGFVVYTEHCGKCHRIRDVGGDVGPALDRENSLASLLTTEQLRDYVRHDKELYPQSKMPQFSQLLEPAELNTVVAYLQAMQPAK